jgi:hypothetical protein
VDHIGILPLIALVLATYRITRLITADVFPFEPLRLKVQGSGTKFEYLLSCPFCVSVWVGGFLAAGQGFVGDEWPWQVFVGAMALSATTCLLAALAPHSFD